jgi:hypothetical protein
LILAVLLVGQGVVQTFSPYQTAPLVEGIGYEQPLVDENGEPVTMTENTLTEAALDGGDAYTYSLGARVSLVDASHFHVEAFIEHLTTRGWKEAETLKAVANVNDTSLDVTGLVAEHADVVYRYGMTTYGLTIGVPLRRNTKPNQRLTPYLTVGRMNFSADVEARIHPDFRGTIEALGVDPEDISRRRSVQKSSWSGLAGTRWDVNRNWSLEGSFSYAKTNNTTIKVIMLVTTIRFDLSSLGKASVNTNSLPF